MRSVAIIALTMALAGPAAAGSGFSAGGMAEGMENAERLAIERRAVEIDRQYGTNHYRNLRQEFELQELRRELQENNRLRREQQWRSILR